jgi:uncharacterized small protein (DUF1192 family)
MGIFEDDPVKPVQIHQIGQDLSLLSVDELNHRIARLKEEIARLEREVEAKGSTRSAAEAVFRKQ